MIESTDEPRSRTERDPVREIIASADSLIVRIYCRIRFTILREIFLEEIGQYLPRNGRVLDIGCGFGFFSLYFAAVAPDRRVLGLDLNARRIEWANNSGRKLGLSNVRYEVADAEHWENDEGFDAVYLLDLLHHMRKESVPTFLSKLRSSLREGGMLIVKEVEDRPRWKMWFTLILDRLMVGREPIHYWPAEEMTAMLESLGTTVYRHRMRDILPYPHILYVCRVDASARRTGSAE